MQKTLKDLQTGEEFTGFVVLKNFILQNKATGEPYFRVEVADKSMAMQGICWEDPAKFNVTRENIGSIIKIKGTRNEYNGQPQFRIYNVRQATREDEQYYDVDALIDSAPIDIDSATEDVLYLINSLEDEEYKQVCLYVFEQNKEKFTTIPAGKTVHHSFRGGLLMHTHNMMEIADFVANQYEDVIDRSLLVASTFLHDMAKIQEFSLTEQNLVSEYSKEGQLLGHIYMGASNIREVCERLGISEEKTLMLQHMVLSHHGEGEMGSPVTPHCAEAEALHIIDLLDSRLEIYSEEYKNLEPGEFSSKKNWALDHRIYRNK